MDTMTITNKDSRWYQHPDRPCRNRPEFADPQMLPQKGRVESLRRLAFECQHYCPVLIACLMDALGHDQTRFDLWGVQGGVIWRTEASGGVRRG